MVIQNSKKLLNELSQIEKEIARLEQKLKNLKGSGFDSEEILKKILSKYYR